MFRFLCLLYLLLHSYQISAQNAYCNDKPLSLAFFTYGYLYQDNDTGIDADLVKILQERTGCQIVTTVQPRARTWYSLSKGSLDMTTAGTHNNERELYSWFLPYMQLKNVAILPSDLPSEQQSSLGFLADKNLYFGVVRGFIHGKEHDRIVEQLAKDERIIFFPDASTLFEALRRGRVHGLFSQAPVYRYYLDEELKKGRFKVIDWVPEVKGTVHHLVLQRKTFSAEQAGAWLQLLAQLKSEGVLTAIFFKYLTEDEVEQIELTPD